MDPEGIGCGGPASNDPQRTSIELMRAKIPYFRIYALRSTYATRLSTVVWWAGGAEQADRKANEDRSGFDTEKVNRWGFVHGFATGGVSLARFGVPDGIGN